MMADPPKSTSPPPATPTHVLESSSAEGGMAAGALAVRSSQQSTSPSVSTTSSTPPWVKWSRGLDSVLEDQEGVDLLVAYLNQEGCGQQLDFWWACEGLKSEVIGPSKVSQMIRSIYRHFVQNNTLLGLTDKTRTELGQAWRDGLFDSVHFFDSAQQEVDLHMREHLYPNFMKSDVYLNAVAREFAPPTETSIASAPGHRVHSDPSSSDESSSISRQRPLTPPVPPLRSSSKLDPGDNTWDREEAILEGSVSPGASTIPLVSHQSSTHTGIPSASLSSLLPNQLPTVLEDRELNVARATHGGKGKGGLTKEALLATQLARAQVGPHSSKNRKRESYTKSGQTAPHPYHASYSSYNPVSRVDSEIQSLSSGAMTDDGGRPSSSGGRCKHHRGHSHGHLGHHHDRHGQISVPHPSRVVHRDNLPDIPKPAMQKPQPRDAEINPEGFATILIQKLEEVKKQRELDEKLSRRISECEEHEHPSNTEETSQHILAAAIQRLQLTDDGRPDDILDKHVSQIWPDITPDARSPRLHSPTTGRRRPGPITVPGRHRRDRDTFSVDSGNVHDYFPETTPPPIMPKSRSVPYELRMHAPGEFGPSGNGALGARPRVGRGLGGPMPKVPNILMKKASIEALDSGISVFSGAGPSAAPQPTSTTFDRVSQWVEQSQSSGDDKPSMSRSATSPSALRRQRKLVPQVVSQLSAAQTVEEARRRLNNTSKKVGPFAGSSGPLGSGHAYPMGSSSLTRRPQSPPSSEDSFMSSSEAAVSSFVFYDDSDVPFGFKIPLKGVRHGITLALFKEHLPKRGHFRFFFKRECTELESKVVQEEVTAEHQVLPLYEGKIIAHLQTVSFPSPAQSMQASMNK